MAWENQLSTLKQNVVDTELSIIDKTDKTPVLSTIDKTVAPKKSFSTLSTIDRVEKEPKEKHDTRAVIAKDLGWSTGKVAMADVVFKEAEKKPELKTAVLFGIETQAANR